MHIFNVNCSEKTKYLNFLTVNDEKTPEGQESGHFCVIAITLLQRLKSILVQYFISIPPEKVRKPEVFRHFKGV